jgi:hypothetical protein
MDKNEKKNIIRVFNSKQNVNGQLIRVIFATQAAAEGINLYNIRQIHIMEPHWDNVMIDQVIGRGFRLNAHQYIAHKEERVIKVYKYFCVRPSVAKLNEAHAKHLGYEAGDPATPKYYDDLPRLGPNAKMTDHLIQTIADSKDTFNSLSKGIRIKSAVDCYLNHQYNSPKEGCYEYLDRQGSAYAGDIRHDITNTKVAKTKEVEAPIKFVTLTTADGETKSFFYYAGQTILIKVNGETEAQEVYKLYGPTPVPEDTKNYKIPEHVGDGGYLKGKQHIRVGFAKEILKH